jgi:hypothetical protein
MLQASDVATTPIDSPRQRQLSQCAAQLVSDWLQLVHSLQLGTPLFQLLVCQALQKRHAFGR